ncbi:hypothetical protein LKACC12383_02357 [Companilactobacillus kimchii]|uniref:Uncharacterized protein n=1 Tax=Companilactobacillus kimchii TaxID=2801452 RepID=A0A210P6P5_9LACO|nr:hypothetical protein LKACC12383_02357 [Companilactobacillus kimchii]
MQMSMVGLGKMGLNGAINISSDNFYYSKNNNVNTY